MQTREANIYIIGQWYFMVKHKIGYCTNCGNIILEGEEFDHKNKGLLCKKERDRVNLLSFYLVLRLVAPLPYPPYTRRLKK
jgi:predicted nucleic acid-binding Zn ribbon protein